MLPRYDPPSQATSERRRMPPIPRILQPLRCIWPAAAHARRRHPVVAARAGALVGRHPRAPPATASIRPAGAHEPGTSTRTISAVAERAGAPGLVVTLRRGFALFDPAEPATPPRYLHEPDREDAPATASTTASATRRAASGAAPWTSTPRRRTGALYRFDADGQCEPPRRRLDRHQRPDLVARRPHDLLQRHRPRPHLRLRLRHGATGALSNRREWRAFAPRGRPSRTA